MSSLTREQQYAEGKRFYDFPVAPSAGHLWHLTSSFKYTNAKTAPEQLSSSGTRLSNAPKMLASYALFV